jgi:hypothetical protein
MFSVRATFAALVMGLAALTHFAQTVPGTINYQGRLTDNTPAQTPLNTTVNMQFAIWDDPTATAPANRLWQEPAGAATIPVAVTNGIFNVLLGGNGVAIPAPVFAGGTARYLQIIAGGETLTPRQTITSTGYANQAQNAALAANATTATTAATAINATQLGGVAASGYQLATVQNCGAGQFLNAIGNGSAGCGSAQTALTPPLTLNGNSSGSIISGNNAGPGVGLQGDSTSGKGVSGSGGTYGVYGSSASGYAGYFNGIVETTGNLSVGPPGTGVTIFPSGGQVIPGVLQVSGIGVGKYPAAAYKLDVAGAVATTQGVKVPIYFNYILTVPPVCDDAWHAIGSQSVTPAVASYADILFTGQLSVQSAAGSNSLSISSGFYVDGVATNFGGNTRACTISSSSLLQIFACPLVINDYVTLSAGSSHLIDVRVKCSAPLTTNATGTLKITLYPQ